MGKTSSNPDGVRFGQEAASRARRRFWRGTASSLALATLAMVAQPRLAHAEAADAAATGARVEEVVVTGSRIARDGSQAPTPLTVVGRDEIQAATPENLADLVNQLPQLGGSIQPRNSNISVSSGQSGFNALNLRDLGLPRTLILIDGQRSVGSSDQRGLVDINTIPQKLVQRVDIVTGGASAVYGSDAVAGVVNFVLDTKYSGLKMEAQAGQTRYDDDHTWQVSATAGADVLGGRGHVLFDAEGAYDQGVSSINRAWARTGYVLLNNPNYTATNGQPRQLVVSGGGFDTITPGGIITSTALRGIQFGPGGTPSQFNYGSIVSDPWMVGGDWQASNSVLTTNALDPAIKRFSVYARGDYDLTDAVQVYATLSMAESLTQNICCSEYNFGNVTVQADNAFLPASVAQQAAALGIRSFSFGKYNVDLPEFGAKLDRFVYRGVLGIDGKFAGLGTDWAWSAYYTHGEAAIDESATNVTNTARLTLARDAVRNPATGAIVCRSTLTNPNNGCVPYNQFGTGVNSQAVVNYLEGEATRHQKLTQDVVAAQISGHPLSTWAGPVGVAAGLEHRREAITGKSDALSLQSGWFAGNYFPTFGSYEVTEGFAEVDVPLAKDMPLAHLLNFNGAVRNTNYSTSGDVTTWKAGLVYSPIEDLRFRITRSKDIRAPNLQELYQAPSCLANAPIVNPFTGNTDTAKDCALGGTNLQPEVSKATEYGVVFQPRFLPGLTASIDYFDINITKAIISYARQDIANNCFAGLTAYCAAVIRDPPSGAILQVNRTPFNAASQVETGFDIEASYRRSLSDFGLTWPGAVTLRYVGAHYIKDVLNPGNAPPTNLAGSNALYIGPATGIPSWRHYITLAYSTPSFTGSIIGRGISAGVYNPSNIQCTSGCPTSTVAHTTINNNQMPGAFYVDLSASYKFNAEGKGGVKYEVFGAIENLFNKSPGLFASGPSALPLVDTNPGLYDTLGTTFRLGFRAAL